MRASILASAATLLVATQARIVGFYAPNTAAPGSKVRLEIQTENFSQSIEDVAMSFGITTGEGAFLGSLGQLISTKILGAGTFLSFRLQRQRQSSVTDQVCRSLQHFGEHHTYHPNPRRCDARTGHYPGRALLVDRCCV